MNDLELFNETTINIFTDASVSGTMVCAGYVMPCVLVPGIDTSTNVISSATNNIGEIYAINLAIHRISFLKSIGALENFSRINLFSDSLISVKGLTEWIRSWVRDSKGGVLYSSSGNPVANQSIFLDCIYTILDQNLNISIYHTNGHTNMNDIKGVNKMIDTFYRENGIRLSREEANYIILWNDRIDRETRAQLPADIIDWDASKRCFSYNHQPFELNEYLKLIRR